MYCPGIGQCSGKHRDTCTVLSRDFEPLVWFANQYRLDILILQLLAALLSLSLSIPTGAHAYKACSHDPGYMAAANNRRQKKERAIAIVWYMYSDFTRPRMKWQPRN